MRVGGFVFVQLLDLFMFCFPFSVLGLPLRLSVIDCSFWQCVWDLFYAIYFLFRQISAVQLSSMFMSTSSKTLRHESRWVRFCLVTWFIYVLFPILGLRASTTLKRQQFLTMRLRSVLCHVLLIQTGFLLCNCRPFKDRSQSTAASVVEWWCLFVLNSYVW